MLLHIVYGHMVFSYSSNHIASVYNKHFFHFLHKYIIQKQIQLISNIISINTMLYIISLQYNNYKKINIYYNFHLYHQSSISRICNIINSKNHILNGPMYFFHNNNMFILLSKHIWPEEKNSSSSHTLLLLYNQFVKP